MTIVAAIPGMVLLWMLWSKGYVVQSIRQTEGGEGERLREPISAGRVAGVALAVAGLIGVLLSQPLKWSTEATALCAALLVTGAAVAWLAGRSRAATPATRG
jgi:PAT family beta-lactamase induction signal transducer AmpG